MLRKIFAIFLFYLLFANFIFPQKVKFEYANSSKYKKNDLIKFLSSSVKSNKIECIGDSVLSKADNFFKSSGYFFADIKIDSIVFGKDSTRIKILLSISENKRSILAKVFVKANNKEDSTYVYNQISVLLGNIFLPTEIEKIFSEILMHYENRGFPFAKIKIESIKWDEEKNAELFIRFLNGKNGIIDTIIIKGNKKTKDYVIKRNSGISEGDVYSREKVLHAIANLARLNYFSKILMPKFYYDAENKGILEITVKEKNTNFFDGLLGYVPKNQKLSGYLTGYLKADLRNLLGTERNFNFEWKKLDRNSQSFNVKYTEPWILDYPINLSLFLNQRKQDTSYVQRKYEIDFEFIASLNLKASLLYSFEETIPFGENNLTINHSVFNTSGISFRYDKRNNILLPTEGYFLKVTVKYSKKSTSVANSSSTENKSENLYRIETDATGFLRIYKIHYAAVGIHFRDLESAKPEISDLYRFGGSNTLRGYSEDIFLGSKIIWSNIEYRILISYSSLIFIFFDTGYYFNKQIFSTENLPSREFICGYGAGISFSTGIGMMKISFALGKGDSFSQGKIHFGLSNGF